MTPNKQVADTEIEIPVGSDDVWEALTSDSGLASWMGEGASIDARPGGLLSTPDLATGRPKDGLVEAVDPGRELKFVWWPADDPAERSHVAISLEATETGTKVVVVETLPTNRGAGLQANASAAWSWRAALCAVSLRIRVH